ncbi:MAG: V-type ATP synthase subunit I [Treponema sp.]|jgi:V/A-type H+-transporting ATPase subunit I|nr:V-type ATP synthase subunit I [Treponema sp.]
MKKVSLVVMDKNREASLTKLREIGVVHLEKRNVSSDTLSVLLDRKAKAEAALGFLRGYSADTGATGSVNIPEAPDLITQVLGLVDRRKVLQDEIFADSKERTRIEKWGNFDPRQLDELANAGVVLIPYELPRKIYETLSAEQRVIVLSKEKAIVYCVALDTSLAGEQAFVLPAVSMAELDKRMAEKQQALVAIEGQFAALAPGKNKIERAVESLLQDIEFETAKVGMDTLGDTPLELAVSWITGFVPEDAVGLVKRAAAENGWALLVDDPKEDDNPPTLVKNNAFIRLVHPLFNLLGTIPGYREYDISLSYLLFFSLFFAMIFGDAGYGSILFIVSLIGGIKAKGKTGKVPDGFLLLGLLSLTTMVWGSVTGSWFAIAIEHLPPFLQALIIPPFNPTKLDVIQVQQNIKHFCFIVGAGQIVLAHLKNIKKALPSLTAIAQIGWLCMMVGLYFLVLNVVLSRTEFPVPSFALYLIIGGLVAFFVFSEQSGGNFFKKMGKGFSNFLPTFLSAVSSFSDIISYIRLFAVGLAGSAIASSFNAMAGGLPVGPARIIGGGLILLAGHGLNIAMNALSVVVHGVRLNLLEYAGHLGMEWSGHTYSPFALKEKGSVKD